jgi:drug/metabolite transporter (DMT)-like permease
MLELLTRPARWTAPRRLGLPVALVSLWLLFGSAFIGLKIGVTALPPFLFSGSRFLVAGAILLAWSAWRSGWRPGIGWGDVAAAGLVGLGLMAGGQGAASWASQFLSPGILAVLVTTVPVWVALFTWIFLGQRPPAPALAGIGVGFAGVVFLASPSGGAGLALLPALVVIGGAVSWAAASLYGSRTAISRRPLLATSIQLLAGGAVQVGAGLVTGQAAGLHPGALLGPAGAAWLFLLLGPSLLGFPLFTWLLASTPPPVANAQAYVSPVVALVLGWLVLGSPVGPRTLAAASVILASVALIVSSAGRRRRPAADAGEPAAGGRQAAA